MNRVSTTPIERVSYAISDIRDGRDALSFARQRVRQYFDTCACYYNVSPSHDVAAKLFVDALNAYRALEKSYHETCLKEAFSELALTRKRPAVIKDRDYNMYFQKEMQGVKLKTIAEQYGVSAAYAQQVVAKVRWKAHARPIVRKGEDAPFPTMLMDLLGSL
jgi:hypothetical protein